VIEEIFKHLSQVLTNNLDVDCGAVSIYDSITFFTVEIDQTFYVDKQLVRSNVRLLEAQKQTVQAHLF
jgi:hypothetical protein